MTKRIIWGLLVACILCNVSLAALALKNKNHTVDEVVHISAGYTYLTNFDFRLNPEHPPLVKMVAAIPLLFMHLDGKIDSPYYTYDKQWDFGHEFIYNNTSDPELIALSAKLPMLLFAMGLIVSVFFWSRRLFGVRAGLLAATFTAFSPLILAHENLVTTDVPIALFFFLAIWAFTEYIQKPTWRRFSWLTIALAAALLTKFSAPLLFPIGIAILIVWSILTANGHIGKSLKKNVAYFLPRLLFASILALIIVWACYGFQWGAPSQSPVLTENKERVATWLGFLSPEQFDRFYQMRIPLFSFLEGLFYVFTHNVGGHDSYFMGQFSNRGWWYYFPVLLAVKNPLPLLLVLVIGFIKGWHSLWRSFTQHKLIKRLQNTPFAYLVIAIAPLGYLLQSMTAHINLGVRYVMPVMPFAFVIAGAIAARLLRFEWGRVVVVIAISWSIAIAFWSFPNYIPYYNEIAGGPEHGAWVATDSNYDWGQDLKGLKQFLNARGNPPLAIVYFGTANIDRTNYNYLHVPTSDEIAAGAQKPPLIAISVSALYDAQHRYDWLFAEKPIARIGYSINVYQFDR